MVKLRGKLRSVLALAMAVILLVTMAMPTLAAGTASIGSVAGDINGGTIIGQDVDQGKQTEYVYDIEVGGTPIQEECDVYATVPNSDIVVTVPKVQVLDGKAGASNSGVYTIEVRGDISADTVITVEPVDEMEDRAGVNFEMSSAGKKNIPTDVDQEKTSFTYEDGVRPDVPATTTGFITAYGMTAGKWNGNFTFEIKSKVYTSGNGNFAFSDDSAYSSDLLIHLRGYQIVFKATGYGPNSNLFDIRGAVGVRNADWDETFNVDGVEIIEAGFVRAIGTDVPSPKMADVVNLVENGVEFDGYSKVNITNVSNSLAPGAYTFTCIEKLLTKADLDKEMVYVGFISWDTDGDGVADNYEYTKTARRISFAEVYYKYLPDNAV